MTVTGAKLGILKLKYTITIIYQTGFLLSTWKIMRFHDVIILFILPEWTKMSFLMQLTAVSWISDGFRIIF